MKTMNCKFLWSLLALILPVCLMAQSSEPQMADTFRSEGKIYVVIAVLSIIFVCLIAYLIYIDIKVKKLEKSKNR